MLLSIQYALISMRNKLMNALSDESGEVNIVAIVVLIGIAVLLAIVFKDAIGELLSKMFGTISQNATDTVDQKITTKP